MLRTPLDLKETVLNVPRTRVKASSGCSARYRSDRRVIGDGGRRWRQALSDNVVSADEPQSSLKFFVCGRSIAVTQPRVDGRVGLSAGVDGAADLCHVGLGEAECRGQARPVFTDTFGNVGQPRL